MFPWDHLAVGYVAYSLLARLQRVPTDGRAVLALAFGTQFPDLVDKPLAWGLGVLPSGTSLAHSVLFAVPVTLAVWLVTRRTKARRAGMAFAVGYLLHLPGDLLYWPLVRGDPVEWGHVLWPLVSQSGPGNADGLLTTVVFYLDTHRTSVRSLRAVGYLLVELGLLLGAVALWVSDGTPGVRWLRRPRSGE